MSKKINIGLVLPAMPGYSETFIHNKINGLIKNGFKVVLFVSRKENSVDVHQSANIYYQVNINSKINLLYNFIKIFVLNPLICFRFLNLERASCRVWTEALKNLIINSHIIGKPLDWLHFGFATVALRRENVAEAMGAKLAVSFRGFDVCLYPHQNPDCYNLLWKKIDKVHTISNDLYQRALSLGLSYKTPVVKITPAIDTEIFRFTKNQNLHVPLRILTIGRLVWKKGYEYALKSLDILKNRQIEFEYHIVGEGSYREPIIYAIKQLGLTDHVKLKGYLSQRNIIKELEWADIYIQPSIQEGFCNSVLEAQAMGLLCIVSNAEGLAENVQHKETAWVIPKRDSECIANQVINILNTDEKALKQIKENAGNRVRKKYNLPYQEKEFCKFYINNKY